MNDQLEQDINLDSMVETLKSKQALKEDKELVAFWIPKSKKEKFDKIQTATGKSFGKEVQDILCRAIDRINLEDFEAS